MTLVAWPDVGEVFVGRRRRAPSLPAWTDGRWWDVLACLEYAKNLLEDSHLWSTKSRGARRYSTKHPPAKRSCSPLHRRAVKWSATGAIERGAGDTYAPAVVLALDVIRRIARRPLCLVEEERGYRGMMSALERAACFVRNGLWIEKQPRRRRSGAGPASGVRRRMTIVASAAVE